MIITITTSHLTLEQFRQSEDFLPLFLPKLRNFPGVINLYHYVGPDPHSRTTLVIWASEQDMQTYRQSDLVKEANTFAASMGEQVTRETYPLLYSD
jgi:heme-degrading monooxygenase HmoA